MNKDNVKNEKTYPTELYLVWQDGPDEQFFNQYTDLEDAVSSEGSDTEILVAYPKVLGKYELVTKVVKKTNKRKK